jgi:DNA-binding CsgD family transcriptional regulator
MVLNMTPNTSFEAISRIIGAIGEPGFERVAAEAVLSSLDFELAALIVHRQQKLPVVMFENFAQAGGQQGIANYVALTHRINPVLNAVKGNRAVRSRDFAQDFSSLAAPMRDYVVPSAREELGFRTVGWPADLEEIGLYFEGEGGLVEFSLSRPRSRRTSSARQFEQLQQMTQPLAAAFAKHAVLAQPNEVLMKGGSAGLTMREAQIVELMLTGCGSDAIARRLDIAHYTVKDYRKRIFRKLKISSLAELFALNAARLRPESDKHLSH